MEDEKFIEALFTEYNKSYNQTKPGHTLPRWFDDEQLKWVITVLKRNGLLTYPQHNA